MNYLEICQRTHDLVGFQGRFLSVDATGYQAVLTQAVQDAYEDIQRYRRTWNWLKTHRNVNVGAGKTVYPLKDLWAQDTPDLAAYRYINWHETSGAKHRLMEVHYDAFMLMNFTEATEPRLYSIQPWDKSLLISPVDKTYTLDLYYIKTLDILKDNLDEPLLPLRHQQAIVYGAVMKLSTFVGNPTLYDTYSVKYAEEMGQLMREENPARWVIKRPIA